MKLKNKIALITGAALGFKNGGPSIGGAIAKKFASEGAKVVVIDILEEMGQKTIDQIKDKGGEGICIKADVTNSNEIHKVIKIIEEKYKGLHILANCAASYKGDIFRNVVDIPEEDWKNVLDVNLNGYFRCAKYAIPLILKSGGGTIVNISSYKSSNKRFNKNFGNRFCPPNSYQLYLSWFCQNSEL
ncbi:MAG: SDR family oxidoreductase [Candidatus Lokiarchaeota archaeon]